MQNNDTSGKRIRKLIDRRGLTDKAFAQLIKTNPQTLSRILCDKYVVSPKMAAKIANALNISPEYILCQTNDPGGNFVGSDNGYNTDINKNDLENIGKRLRTLIEKKGMLKKDFASLAGITPQTLSKIINGKYINLSPRLVEKFSQLLNTNINYILCKSDDPGDNFVGSDNWYKRNSQYFYISGVISYLESLTYTITELLIIGNLEFARDNKTLMFSTLASKRDLLDYGFALENISNIDDVIKYETTEGILIEIIEKTDIPAIKHCWEIEFQGTHKRINEQKFLDIMYSFSMITHNYFNAALHDFNKIHAELSELGSAIQKSNQTI